MPDEPEKPRDDPATSWDDDGRSLVTDGSEVPVDSTDVAPVDAETVGTGSYVAVSCVAGMGLLLLLLIVGLLISRWLA